MLKICRTFVFFRTKRYVEFTQGTVMKRYLYSADVLGITYYEEGRKKEKQHSYYKKDDFLKSLKERLHDGKFIFTEEIAKILYITEPDDDFDLVFKVVQRYQDLQDKALLKTDFPLGITTLLMLYFVKRPDLAFKWFLEDKDTVRPVCRSSKCFMIMMDMLHDTGQHKDVISLLSLCDKFIDRKYPELLCLALSALYKMNSEESCKQMLYLLSEQSKVPVQLTDRCAMLCCMLAYKQVCWYVTENKPFLESALLSIGKIDLILELMQLPVFVVARNQTSSLMLNMKILVYIKTGKIKQAADILKELIYSYKKPHPIIFDEVLLKLQKEACKHNDMSVKENCVILSNSLRTAGLVVTQSLEEFFVTEIKSEEFEKLTTKKNPLNIHNKENRYSDFLISKYLSDYDPERIKL